MSGHEGGAEEPTRYRILVADDDPDIRRLVATYLELEGFDVEEAADGAEAVDQTIASRPDLVILDIMMPNKSGTEALAELRADFRTAFTPILFLTAKSMTSDKVGGLMGGADDYVVKPFDPQELVARVENALRRSRALRGLNPLTGLPGNTVIAEEIAARLDAGRPFACLYADLDNFKALNDHYGFSRGDEVIGELGEVLLGALEEHQTADSFAGHVGGDDFVVLCAPELAEQIAGEICARFDERVREYYNAEDRDRGWVEVEDRRGQVNRFPICSVSVGIVDSASRTFASGAEVAEVAAEVKGLAKRDEGSSYRFERRRD